MILYLNACPRNGSRTDRLAKALLFAKGAYTEVKLDELDLLPLNDQRLSERMRLQANGDFSIPYFDLARQFAEAEEIVVGAPFWDGSFPSIFKIYLENIYVVGLVTEYDSHGVPRGKCKAKKLTFVTTAGGPYIPDFGYCYVRDLAINVFGIPETELVYAQNLDIDGNDAEAILNEAIRNLNN